MLIISVLAIIAVLYALAKLRGLHVEAKRQSKILYDIAAGKTPNEELQPRGGFFSEFKRGLRGED